MPIVVKLYRILGLGALMGAGGNNRSPSSLPLGKKICYIYVYGGGVSAYGGHFSM